MISNTIFLETGKNPYIQGVKEKSLEGFLPSCLTISGEMRLKQKRTEHQNWNMGLQAISKAFSFLRFYQNSDLSPNFWFKSSLKMGGKNNLQIRWNFGGKQKILGQTVINLHCEDQNAIKPVTHLLAIKKQIKHRLCGLRSCLWQEAQEISLHVKSQNPSVSIHCLYTQQIRTRLAPSYVETLCVWLANPKFLLPMGISAAQSPFWSLIKES